MAVVNDYKCPKHGYFEARKAQCPMKDCHEEVLLVFLQAPSLVGDRTKAADKQLKQLAIEFDMSDIKSTREGENQAGYLKRKNKFTENGVNKDKLKPAVPQVQQEARPGDGAIWGGGFQGMNMQSLLGGMIKPIRDEQVGLTPGQAGIKTGPTTLPGGTMRDPDNLQIKK